jgi:serine/threonine protein kinase/tetratricopeptide (TPR) repeat protein
MSLPELMGPYLLHRSLAQGTTAEVFLAQTTGDFPRVCAVKVIRPEVAALPGFAERFRHDAALLVRLIHGNLVQVLEVGAVEERLFVAMELIDGIALTELIAQVPEQGPLPAELALYVGLEMCEAVTYIQLHRREVSGTMTFPPDAPWPLEVMLSFDGVVKVVDLGSFGAIHLGQQRVSRLFQSPGYAVPEVVLKRTLDQRSDIFAVGVVLWELLEGKRLLSSDPEGYIRDVLKGRWSAALVQRKDLSGDVIRLVGEMLSLDPDKRPVGIEAIRTRLVGALRRVAPTYGSSSVARLLWYRCQHLIHETEQMVTDVIRRASTDRAVPSGVSTQSFGHVAKVDREIGEPAPLSPGDPVPGTRYRIIRQVGQGGSAEVFAAQHIDLDRQVAIKVLSARLAGNSAAIAQFRLEARACSRVGHPNIVEVIDFGELEDGRFFFAMELLDGKSLADVLDNEEKLPPGRAIGIFRQIAKALHETHKRGIVHRDLKPENVMLVTRDERSDFVKLLDFGVMAFGTQAPGHAVGTTGYMAPEQVRGEPPTPAMDIYAVGATLYEALCGMPPYPCETYEEFRRLQAEQPPPALRSQHGAEGLPEALERVVHRALERDPAARHPSIADFEVDLLRAQREAKIETPWDDLPLPRGQKDKRSSRELRSMKQGKRPAARLWPAAFAISLGAALVLTALQMFPLDESQPPARSAAPPPARVRSEVKPEPVELVRLLERAEQAVSEGRFTHPEGKCALDLLREAERRFPGYPPIGKMRGRIARHLEGSGDLLLKEGNKASARILYQQALLFAPNSRRLERLADLEKMRTRQRSALPRPKAQLAEVAWLLSRFQLAVFEGRYVSPPNDNALRHLNRLKQVDPTGRHIAEAEQNMSRKLRQRADEAWRKGDRETARPLYRLVGLLDSSDAVAKQRSRALDAGPAPRAKRAAAAAPAKEERSVDPARARQLVSEGRALLRKGKLSDAEIRFREAVSANPRSSRAYTGLATLAFERGNYLDTVQLARRVLRMNPREVQGHLLLGDAYFQLSRFKDALKAWEDAQRIAPRNPSVTRRIEKLKQRPSM